MSGFKFDKKTDDLFKAILKLESVEEAEDFFRDLCTLDEIQEMSTRWQIAKLVYSGMPYEKIAKKLGVSESKVSRVAVWVFHGEGGYKSVLEKTKKNKLFKIFKK